MGARSFGHGVRGEIRCLSSGLWGAAIFHELLCCLRGELLMVQEVQIELRLYALRTGGAFITRLGVLVYIILEIYE